MNEDVTQYINKQLPWQIEVCEKLRKIVFAIIPDVEERIQYGKPHYLKNGSYACVISVAKDKVSFMIFNAGQLEEIKDFFKSMNTPDRKTATIKEATAVDYELLSDLLKKAVSSS